MANLRQLLAENADTNGGNADDPQAEMGMGSFRARMPVPAYTPDSPTMGMPVDQTPGGAPQPIDEGAARTAVLRGQSTESPRERASEPNGMTSSPRMPSVPTPQAGAASPAIDASAGVIPFAPMAGADPQSQVMPQGPAPVGASLRSPASLFGSLGGLTGGGLGMPQDPTTRANNGSIDGLLQLIQQMQGR